MSMQNQLATMRMAGAIQQSTDVMKNMQQLVKMPEMMQTMREMSREMTKAGIMEEMIEETMESLEPEELEEQAEEEIDRILYEVTAGELGKLPKTATASLEQEQEKQKSTAIADQFIQQMESSRH